MTLLIDWEKTRINNQKTQELRLCHLRSTNRVIALLLHCLNWTTQHFRSFQAQKDRIESKGMD